MELYKDKESLLLKSTLNLSFNITALLLLTLSLSCCIQKKNNNTKKIFRYNEAAGIVTLDPAFARDQAHTWVCNQLYDGLVQLSDNLEVLPSIAKSWEITPDGMTYTFHLRKGILFHQNKAINEQQRLVTASDIAFSLGRILDPKTASPGAWVLSSVRWKNNKPEIYALNDSTLSIHLRQPFPPFLSILSMPYCSIIPEEAINYYGKDFRMNPVGTGPFQMQNWVENIKLVLKRNDHYFEKEGNATLPYLDGVAISFLIDKMTSFMEFAKGNFDFISGIDPSYKDELLTKSGTLKSKYQNRFNLLSQPFLNTEYLAIMMDTTLPAINNSPLVNKNIRLALNYGFDRKKMLRYLRNNIGKAGHQGIIPNGMQAYNPKAHYGYDYQPSKAKQLLKEAGFDEANPAPPIAVVTTPDYLDLVKFAQAQWEEIGLNVAIEVSPPASVREMKAQGKLPFFRASWIADYPDEENYLSLFTTQNFAPQGPNYTHFSNPYYDSIYKEAMQEVDLTKRIAYYQQLDSLIMQEAPIVVLYYDESIRIVQKNIQGITTNPMNMLNLKHVKK